MSKDFEEQVRYWRESSAEDFRIAELLFERGYYSQSLFFCHLSVEKLLKALVMEKTQDYAPYTHDLLRLVEAADVEADETKNTLLQEMFTFNIAGRYEDVKLAFHKKYNNREIAERWTGHTKDVLQWLNEKFQKE